MCCQSTCIRFPTVKWIEITLLRFGGLNPETVLCGMPQGSILRILLFLIYINDLPKELSFETRLFADDTSLFMTNSNLNHLNE